MTGTRPVSVVDCGRADEPLLARLAASVPTTIHLGAPDSETIVERAQGVSVLATLYTYTAIDADVLARLPDLRLVATRTAGHTHIDTEAAARRGVAVATVPTASTQAVAEYVVGSVLAAQRRLLEASLLVQAGTWSYQDFQGFELADSTLGVVGLGATGTRVAELSLALGMRVLGWSRSGRSIAGVQAATLEQLLSESDIVTIHVALNAQTRNLIGAAQLDLLSEKAWLVNPARGGIVDEQALVERLEQRRLGGAVLDVLEEEPPSSERLSRLRDVPNLLVTPHIAWNTTEAVGRQFAGMTDNILSFLDGAPRNIVTTATSPRKET